MEDEQKPEISAHVRQRLAGARSAQRIKNHNLYFEKDMLALRSYDRRPWPLFQREAGEYLDEMDKFFPDAKSRFAQCIEERNEQKKPIIVVELAGAADATGLGADVTISATLRSDIGRIPGESQVIVEGDLLQKKVQDELLRSVRTHGKISLLVFLPKGAAGPYASNAYAYDSIGRLLSHLEKEMAPLGQMYVNLDYIRTQVPLEKVFEGTNSVVESGAPLDARVGIDQWKSKNVFRILQKESKKS